MVEWKKIEGESMDDDGSTIWKPELVDEWISGRYTNREDNTGLKGDSTLYHIVDGGKHWKVWGNAVLNSRFKDVPLESMVKIVYCGKRRSQKGNMYNVFDVYVAQDDGDEDNSSPSSSSSGQGKPKVKPVAGKLRFTANGLIKDARSNLVGYGNMEPSEQDIKKELQAMYDDGDMNNYKPYKKGDLLSACNQLVEEAHKEYEEFLQE